MMTLYHFPASLNSQKVLLTLAEKGLSWDSQVVNLALGKQYNPEYIRINPNASVPTLVIGDTVLTDSYDIVDYLYQHYRDDDHGNAVDYQLCHDWMQRIARLDERIFTFGLQQGRKKTKGHEYRVGATRRIDPTHARPPGAGRSLRQQGQRYR